jgi:hypothetical protein
MYRRNCFHTSKFSSWYRMFSVLRMNSVWPELLNPGAYAPLAQGIHNVCRNSETGWLAHSSGKHIDAAAAACDRATRAYCGSGDYRLTREGWWYNTASCHRGHRGVLPRLIGRYFPSSRLHNGCGGYKANLELAEREWICPGCGQKVDRDLNAARNIRDEALRVSVVPGVATSAR